MTQPGSRIIAARALLTTIEPEERRLQNILEQTEISAADKSQAEKQLELLTKRRILILADLEDEGG
jgi:hypothetical protein